MRLTHHALKRMRERDISADEIAEALDNLETSYPSAQDESRTVILGTTRAQRRLKVVVKMADDTVITVADRDEEG